MRKTWSSSNTSSSCWLSLARLFQRASERLLDDHPHLDVVVPAAPISQVVDVREDVGRGRQVERAVERFPGLEVELVEHPIELGVDRLLVEFPGYVLDVLEEALQHVLVVRRREYSAIACSHFSRKSSSAVSLRATPMTWKWTGSAPSCARL